MTVGVEIPNYLKSGDLARLIPVVADNKKEERITSSLLSALMAVPPLANSLFEAVGAPVRKKAQIVCFTEVVFDDPSNERTPRPDGLIIVKSGKRQWSALIESKIGKSNLDRGQVEEYLTLAKRFQINALITFSNQFAALPTHHPLDIPANKLRSVELFHFSWMAMLIKAQVLSENGELVDPEQAYIVRELIRYLKHDSSGVVSFNSMGKQWKDICSRIQAGASFRKSDEGLSKTVSDWHELNKYMSLELTSSIGRPVDIVIAKTHSDNPDKRLEDDVQDLANSHTLNSAFRVPNAAAPISFSADFMRRTIRFSVKLPAPQDKSLATACINFYTRQLKGYPAPEKLIIRAHWPGRAPDTDASLAEAIADPKVLLSHKATALPKFIEIFSVLDLAGKFPATRSFVEITNNALKEFYADVGQNLKAWMPSAPRVKEHPEKAAPTHQDTSHQDMSSQESNLAESPIRSAIKDDELMDIPTFLIRRPIE